MPVSSTAARSDQDNLSWLGGADLLPRYPIFRARDLECVCHYLSGVLAPHRLTYWTRERRLDFRHRVAKLGAIELNALQFGGDVMVAAPHLPDFYLLHFMLAGNCTLTQGGRWFDEPSGSVAVINPNRPFAKKLSSAGRQLLVRIERRLIDRELQAWTGREPKELIEFDQSGAFAVEKVPTLTHAVRMLCDDLRDESSSLDHPLVRRRIASTLASALLVGLPHNYSRAFEAGEFSIAPASVRRAERFIEENAMKAIGLADVASAAESAHGRCRRASVASATPPRWRIYTRYGWTWRAANWPEPGAMAVRSPLSQSRTGLGLSAGSRQITGNASTSRLQKRCDAVLKVERVRVTCTACTASKIAAPRISLIVF